jgi:hypothetical protein
MMQMLSAGGMAVLTDRQRSADANNPRGYYELEAVKSLARNSGVVAEGEGKVIKVISSLLAYLPNGHQYRVIFMRRPLDEILASQDRMLERLGKEVPPAPRESVKDAFEQHLRQVRGWLSEQPNMTVHYVDYPAVLQEAHREAHAICGFRGHELVVDTMDQKV